MVVCVGPMFYKVLNSLVDFSLYGTISGCPIFHLFSPFLDSVQVSVLRREGLNVIALQYVLSFATTALGAVPFLRVECKLSSFNASLTTQAAKSMYSTTRKCCIPFALHNK